MADGVPFPVHGLLQFAQTVAHPGVARTWVARYVVANQFLEVAFQREILLRQGFAARALASLARRGAIFQFVGQFLASRANRFLVHAGHFGKTTDTAMA